MFVEHWIESLVPALVELLPEAKAIAVAGRFDGSHVARATFTSLEIGAECVVFANASKDLEETEVNVIAPIMAGWLRDSFVDSERERMTRGDYE